MIKKLHPIDADTVVIETEHELDESVKKQIREAVSKWGFRLECQDRIDAWNQIQDEVFWELEFNDRMGVVYECHGNEWYPAGFLQLCIPDPSGRVTRVGLYLTAGFSRGNRFSSVYEVV